MDTHGDSPAPFPGPRRDGRPGADAGPRAPGQGHPPKAPGHAALSGERRGRAYITRPLRAALTCAGSDSGGGAGIQADLKTFAAMGVYGFCAISSVTAQNSFEVTSVSLVPPECFKAQLEAVASDFRVDAVKAGLLGCPANTGILSDFLAERLPGVPAVVDPVMVSAAGHVFLDGLSVKALEGLLARAFVATPNIPEAARLASMEIRDAEGAVKAARRILEMGPRYVLVKGGHLPEGRGGPEGARLACDFLAGRDGSLERMGLPYRPSRNTHGTGCTLSSAIAAGLALGLPLPAAARAAKRFVWEAMDPAAAPALGGKGPGPLHHFYGYYGFCRGKARAAPDPPEAPDAGPGAGPAGPKD